MATAISCLKALEQWESKNKKKVVEENVVKLNGHTPPIDRMDASLNQLPNCTQLHLSTNCIHTILPLTGFNNLQTLSLSRNCLKKISGLEEVGGTLKQLWLSYNQIEKLDGLQTCNVLEVLYVSNNKIKNVDEVAKLARITTLRSLSLVGNPIYDAAGSKEAVRAKVKELLAGLKILNGEVVGDIEESDEA